MQPAFETFARAAAAFAVFLIALVVLLSVLKDFKAKLDYDWPFIVAYTALFLCIGVMTYLRGFHVTGVALAVIALAIAVFDTIENLEAYRTGTLEASMPKWGCYFVCVLLTVVLFASSMNGLARGIAAALAVAGLLGLIGSFTGKPKLIFGAAGLTILAFLPAIYLFVRKPQALLT